MADQSDTLHKYARFTKIHVDKTRNGYAFSNHSTYKSARCDYVAATYFLHIIFILKKKTVGLGMSHQMFR